MIPTLHTASVGDMAAKAARLMHEHGQIERARLLADSPLVQRGNDVFERAVQRGSCHFQSRDLKKLLHELRQFQARPDVVNTLRIQRALARWADHHPNEVHARVRDEGHSHLDALRNAVDSRHALNTLTPAHAVTARHCVNDALRHHPDVAGWDRLCPGGTFEAHQKVLPDFHRKTALALLVHRASSDLRARSAYVLADAPVLPAGTPARKTIQKFRHKVLSMADNRRTALEAHRLALRMRGANNDQVPDAQALADMRGLMDAGRAATSLCMAYSAAASLLQHNTDGMRVEIIASRGQDFGPPGLTAMQVTYKVLLGRAQGSRLDDSSTWGSDVKVLGEWKGVSPDAPDMAMHTSVLDTCAQVDVPDLNLMNKAMRRRADVRAALNELGLDLTPDVARRSLARL